MTESNKVELKLSLIFMPKMRILLCKNVDLFYEYKQEVMDVLIQKQFLLKSSENNIKMILNEGVELNENYNTI